MRTNWRLGVRGPLVALAAVLVLASVGWAASAAKPKAKEKAGGYLGVYLQDLTRSLRKGLDIDVTKGALVSGVQSDGPADEGGIEEGDVIVAFDGKDVGSADDLRDLVGDTDPGTKVTIDVIRDGERKHVDVTIGERPEHGGNFLWQQGDWGHVMPYYYNYLGRNMTSILGGPRLGVEAADLDDKDLASYFDTKPDEGVLVLGVIDDSVAKKAGVKAGDVIQKIGDKSVSSVEELRKSLRDYDKGDQFDIAVLRKGKKKTLSATMDEQAHTFAWVGPGSHALHLDIDKEDLRQQMDELRSQLKDLKKELEKLKHAD